MYWFLAKNREPRIVETLLCGLASLREIRHVAAPARLTSRALYRSAGSRAKKHLSQSRQDRQEEPPHADLAMIHGGHEGRFDIGGKAHSVAAQQAAVNAAATMHRLPRIGTSPFKATAACG